MIAFVTGVVIGAILNIPLNRWYRKRRHRRSLALLKRINDDAVMRENDE